MVTGAFIRLLYSPASTKQPVNGPSVPHGWVVTSGGLPEASGV